MTLMQSEIEDALDGLRCCWNCKHYRRETFGIDGPLGAVCTVDQQVTDSYPSFDELNPGDKHMPPDGYCDRFQHAPEFYGLPGSLDVPGTKLNYRNLHDGQGGHSALVQLSTLLLEKTKDPEFGRVLLAFALIDQAHHRLKDEDNRLWRWMNYWHVRWTAREADRSKEQAVDLVRLMLDSYEDGMALEDAWWPRATPVYSEHAIDLARAVTALEARSHLPGGEVSSRSASSDTDNRAVELTGWYAQPVHCPFCGEAIPPGDPEGCKHHLYLILEGEFHHLSDRFIAEMGLPNGLSDELPIRAVSDIETIDECRLRARAVFANLVEFQIDAVSDVIYIGFANLETELVGWGREHMSPYEETDT